jgi:pantetheine-phosphate adenylyltransferase
MKTIAVYAGTFDPISLGHLDIIQRVAPLYDELIIGIGINPQKKTMFSESTRTSMIEESIRELIDFDKIRVNRWSVEPFYGLLVDFAKEKKANVLIRGIRNVSDFEYEINLANINLTLAPEIQTFFLPTRPDLGVVSSSAVKELVKHGADISKFVPVNVAKELVKEFKAIKSTS